MYYSIVVDNPIIGTNFDNSWSERAFIGLAETDDLASNVWADKGMVVCSEPDGVKPYSFTGAEIGKMLISNLMQLTLVLLKQKRESNTLFTVLGILVSQL